MSSENKVYTLTLSVSKDPEDAKDSEANTQYAAELVAALKLYLEKYVCQKGNVQLSVVSCELAE
jgi:hypothetical protein